MDQKFLTKGIRLLTFTFCAACEKWHSGTSLAGRQLPPVDSGLAVAVHWNELLEINSNGFCCMGLSKSESSHREDQG